MIPFGNPDDLICRWCSNAKVHLRGGLLCTNCDGPEHAVATWRTNQ